MRLEQRRLALEGSPEELLRTKMHLLQQLVHTQIATKGPVKVVLARADISSSLNRFTDYVHCLNHSVHSVADHHVKLPLRLCHLVHLTPSMVSHHLLLSTFISSMKGCPCQSVEDHHVKPPSLCHHLVHLTPLLLSHHRLSIFSQRLEVSTLIFSKSVCVVLV